MAVFDWPSSLTPQTVSWGIQKAGVQFRSPFAGSVEAVEFPGQFWRVSITLAAAKMRNGGEGEAFFARLAGGSDRVRVPYWPRMTPRGSLGSVGPVTIYGDAVRGQNSIALAGYGTLEPGDMFSAGGQLFQCFQACGSVSGVITVPLVNRVRALIVSTTSVTLTRPTVTCLVPSMGSARGYEPAVAGTLPVDLEEAPS